MSNLQTFMERMAKHSDAAEKMTNNELAEQLIADVWSQMEMDSPESCLVDEAIHRLKDGTVTLTAEQARALREAINAAESILYRPEAMPYISPDERDAIRAVADIKLGEK